MKNKNLIIYIIICLIIIAGIAVWDKKGFKTELQYAPRKQIQLSNHTGIEISDIQAIASEVLGDTEFMVQPVENFGNDVAIVARNITEEQKEQIVKKFNDKYKSELKNEDVKIIYIPFTRIIDIIRPYLIPGAITLAILAIYFIIRFNKIGWKKVIAKTVLIPVVLELLMFSIMSIARMPLSRITVAIGFTLYAISIIYLTVIFENKRNKLIEEKNEKEGF